MAGWLANWCLSEYFHLREWSLNVWRKLDSLLASKMADCCTLAAENGPQCCVLKKRLACQWWIGISSY